MREDAARCRLRNKFVVKVQVVFFFFQLDFYKTSILDNGQERQELELELKMVLAFK